MFREGEVPPEVAAEYEKMEGKNMEPKHEAAAAVERETDVGSLQAGVLSPEDFVKSVLAREGGDPRRAVMATHSIKEFWIKQLDEGNITPQEFSDGVYNAAVKMLKERKGPTEKEKAREEAQKARLENIRGRRAA
ncbi:hypothetical protein HZB93_01925 [Candidatus Falkowbacteria bacterium]|nr:hypothetical protein [Candidatus Falkowbacteria bacterium]